MRNRLVFALMLVFARATCRSQTVARPRVRDSIRIVAISPSIAESLIVGATVAIRVEAEYDLEDSESGTVALVVQQGESEKTHLANEFRAVSRGKGRIAFEKSFVVPDTGAVLVFTPLSGQGATSTDVTATRSYKVVRR